MSTSTSTFTPSQPASEPKTCGSCASFIRQPRKPSGGKAIDLSEPIQGECRSLPPQGQLVNGGGMMIFYPNVPETFPACGLHRAASDSPIPTPTHEITIGRVAVNGR